MYSKNMKKAIKNKYAKYIQICAIEILYYKKYEHYICTILCLL